MIDASATQAPELGARIPRQRHAGLLRAAQCLAGGLWTRCTTTTMTRCHGSTTAASSAGCIPATLCVRLERRLGWHHNFLYTSSGPSLAQYLLAKGVGGRLVAGKVRISKPGQLPRSLRKGEVVELRVTSLSTARRELEQLKRELSDRNLYAVPVKTLLKDSGTSV